MGWDSHRTGFLRSQLWRAGHCRPCWARPAGVGSCKAPHGARAPPDSSVESTTAEQRVRGPCRAGSAAYPLLPTCATAAAAHPSPSCHGVQRSPTWAVLRTAILRTVAGALAPKEAGMDFWTLPKVSAPYLWDKAPPRSCDHCPPALGAGPCSSMLLAPISTLSRCPQVPSPPPLLHGTGPTLPAFPLTCAAGSGLRCRADTRRHCAL